MRPLHLDCNAGNSMMARIISQKLMPSIGVNTESISSMKSLSGLYQVSFFFTRIVVFLSTAQYSLFDDTRVSKSLQDTELDGKRCCRLGDPSDSMYSFSFCADLEFILRKVFDLSGELKWLII